MTDEDLERICACDQRIVEITDEEKSVCQIWKEDAGFCHFQLCLDCGKPGYAGNLYAGEEKAWNSGLFPSGTAGTIMEKFFECTNSAR